MNQTIAPLRITLYGMNNEVEREITRSIVPWGILERALDIQEQFDTLDPDGTGAPVLNRAQIQALTDFVVFVFNDTVTSDALKRGASIPDMLAVYNQIFSMVSQVMPKNPTTALNSSKANLQKVRQGK